MRLSDEQLTNILSRKGYGIVSSLKSGLKSDIQQQAVLNKAGGEGKMSLLESCVGSKSIRPKDFALPHSGRCVVRVKVFRKRLTDTGNDCWKYHLDACRYLGWLEDDNDATISLTEEPHEKVKTDEEERVEITLEFQGIDINDVIEYYKEGARNQPDKP